MLELYDQIEEAAAAIRTAWPETPHAGVILGTGLGGLVEEMEVTATLDYEAIPNFPKSTATSHRGRLVMGRLEGVPVLVMEGRFHQYEGYPLTKITLPVRVMKRLEEGHPHRGRRRRRQRADEAGVLQPPAHGPHGGRLGHVRRHGRRVPGVEQFAHPDMHLLDGADDDTDWARALVPIYPASKDVSSWVIQKSVKLLLGAGGGFAELVHDPLPDDIRARHGLLSLPAALLDIHRPTTMDDVERAAHRRSGTRRSSSS